MGCAARLTLGKASTFGIMYKLQAEEYFMGISTYISYLHMPALAEYESILFIFAWTSVRNLHTLVNSPIAAAPPAGRVLS